MSGAVIEGLIPWIKRTDPKRSGLETVLMDRIHIRARKLTVEMNSAGRAKAFRASIGKAHGFTAPYRRVPKQSLEGKMPPIRPGLGVELVPRNAEQPEQMQ